jgi:class 3 adenylate cyclase/streptogramin lyase
MRRDQATRVLATVFFTDMVDSTRIAAELGDRRWRVLRAAYHHSAREQLRRHGGREVDTAGDGLFATFSDQEQAIRCACAFSDAVRGLGVEVRCGVHVGRADRVGRSLGGIAVHTGARVMAAAGPGEVVVSGVLRDLVSGSDFAFVDLGVRELKGVPDPVHLYRVTAVDGAPRASPLAEPIAKSRRDAIEPPPLLGRGGRGRRAFAIVSGVVVAVIAVAVWVASTSSSKSIHIVPNSLLRINPTSGAVVADVPITPPGGTEFAAVPPHQVWVLSHAHQVISVVDVNHNKLLQPVGGFGLASQQSGWALRYGAGSVWVATENSNVVRIDPLSHQVIPIRLPVGANLLAFGLGKLWAITYDHPNGLFEVDPAVNKARLFTRTGGGVNGIVAGEGAIWVNYPSNTVWKIDPNTGARTRIPLQPGATTPAGMATGFGHVWVSNGGVPQSVSRIDPGTDQVKTKNVCPGTSSVVTDVAAADGSIWMTCPTAREIAKINPITLAVTHIKLHTSGHPTAMISAYGSLWVTIEPCC